MKLVPKMGCHLFSPTLLCHTYTMDNGPAYKDKAEKVLRGKTPWYKKPAVLTIGAFYVILMLVLFTGGESVPEVFPAPDFSLENIMGPEEVSLSDYSGRPVILYFFASW